ncbi:hypothetical protein SLEP1_g35216 [Rubroshorea leprosula]|uniref:Leucine-rich repeat-containing N-terminal plant-type domain-containing protein n=1 Tax=Rubroshorea leprosula TaxID=152421 RepID=A0AAV5KML1_9ROSI|nr:hypothetical protein SLEP1_g35216 [Rubroshorea leprosula]
MVFSFARFFFIILLAFLVRPSFQHLLCRREDRLALLQFKESFVIYKLASSYDPFAYPKVNLWKSQGMDCCSWEGVWCDQDTGHVIGLDLSSSCLLGSINSNSSLFQLTHLQHLNLAFNDFNYSMIPSALANLTNLTYLNLSNSFFSGQISSELSKLAGLSTLDLSSSYDPQYEGLLELERPNLRSLIENLKSLEYLHLSSVKINSRIPNILANMSSLKSIFLGHCGLFGEFPSAIFQLPKLQALIVHYNPGLIGNLPEFHFHSQLTDLRVSFTSFSGKLPASIGMLGSLEHLDASDCKFFGLLPSSLGNITKLHFLSLKNNFFQGKDVPFLSNLTQLTSIYLGLNQFTFPEIPSFFARFTHLQCLGLAFNQISGHFPSWITNMSQLTFLNVASNMLQGSLPSSISKLKNIETLGFEGNNFTGTVEINPFLDLKYLRHLTFSLNKLSLLIKTRNSTNTTLAKLEQLGLGSCNLKEFPNFLQDQDQLQFLSLSFNDIHGQIPKWIWKLNNNFEGPIPTTWAVENDLRVIKLSQNNLQGKLPRLLTNCKMLEFLDLGDNHIKDTFPFWLGTLPKLKILILHSNGLYGSINVLESNSLFPSLQVVDLSHNEFSGLLPTEYFKRWNAMVDPDKENKAYWYTYDNLSVNGVYLPLQYPYSMTITNKGLRLEYAKVLEVFSGVDLSCNKFKGEIPQIVGRLKGLQLLNLSNNILVGPIPPTLGNLTNLEALDLSQNKLIGSIPTQLTQLNFLEVFNVSHNHLTGRIPKGQQFDTFENTSFDGNSGLCGFPLSRKCNDLKALPSPSSTPKGNEDSGLLTKFGWKVVVLGYGCGFLVGVVIGNIVFAKTHEWLMRTYRIRLSRGVMKVAGSSFGGSSSMLVPSSCTSSI